eukprot:GHVL01010386.1.p1 GENE.GHVL01010386.1~~GHVL01010386.1.p1  ORF type:complete len:435 (+),score=82.58 GHVL01010386.1:26-1330(+)
MVDLPDDAARNKYRYRQYVGNESFSKLPNHIEPSQVINGNNCSIESVCWINSKSFLSAGHNKKLHLWNIKNGCTITPHRSYKGHSEGIYHATLSTSKKLVCTGGGGISANCFLWDIDKSDISPVSQFYHESPVYFTAFSQDESSVVTSTNDGFVHIFDVNKSKPSLSINIAEETNTTVQCAIYADAIYWKPNASKSRTAPQKGGQNSPPKEASKIIVACGNSGKIQVRDIRNKQTGLTIDEAHGGSIIYSLACPIQNILLSAGQDFKIKKWDLRIIGQEKNTPVNEYLGHAAPVRSICLSPDGERFVTGAEDGGVRVWVVDEKQQQEINKKHLEESAANIEAQLEALIKSCDEGGDLDTSRMEKLKMQLKEARDELENVDDHLKLTKKSEIHSLCTLGTHTQHVNGCSWIQEDKNDKIITCSWDSTFQIFSNFV